MSLTTRSFLLLCSIAFIHSPASADPVGHLDQSIHSADRQAEITDLSASRRHRRATRRHVHRAHSRKAAVRQFGARHVRAHRVGVRQVSVRQVSERQVSERQAAVRHVRIRRAHAAQVAIAPVPDRFGIAYQSSTVARSAPPFAPQTQRRQRVASAEFRHYALAAQYPASAPTGSMFGGSLIAEARRYVGTNPTGRRSLWCGHFMNMVLKRTGRAVSNSNMARSFASYGRRVSGPQVGAIAVMSRGRFGGHVGIVSGVDASGNPIIISGNHGGRVAETVYPRGRIFAYVMP